MATALGLAACSSSGSTATAVPSATIGPRAPGSGLAGSTIAPSEAPTPVATPTGGPTSTPPPTPRLVPDTLRIAFASTSWCAAGSAHDIMGAAADGSDVTSISCSRGQDVDPAWSPDGTRIAFASDRDGQWDVWVMNADGTDQVRLTDDPLADDHPSWSPDGSRIVFESERDTAKDTTDLWVMNADGSDQERLLAMPGNERYPDWSPDGKRIVFSHFGGSGGAGIWTVRADGTRAGLLAGGPLHDPAWSPDGRWIAYDGEPHGCKFDVYVMAADGKQTRQLTDNPEGCGGEDKHPSWSPDGKTLVYSSTGYAGMKNKEQLLTVPFAGGEPTLIVPYRVEKLYSGPYHPDWSPVR
jgi:Tol biopolymer transport system component